MIEMPQWLQDQWMEEIRAQMRISVAFLSARKSQSATPERTVKSVIDSIRHESHEERQAPTTIWPDRLGRWLKTRYFCIECGQQDVWQEEDAGDDWHFGYAVTCFSCKHRQDCVDGIPSEDK